MKKQIESYKTDSDFCASLPWPTKFLFTLKSFFTLTRTWNTQIIFHFECSEDRIQIKKEITILSATHLSFSVFS